MDIFDKIKQNADFNGLIQLVNTLSKFDECYDVKLEGNVYYIEIVWKGLELSLILQYCGIEFFP